MTTEITYLRVRLIADCPKIFSEYFLNTSGKFHKSELGIFV